MPAYVYSPEVRPNSIKSGWIEYGPEPIEVARGIYRVYATVNKPTAAHPTGTDTISSILTTGSKPDTWELPGKLVADPGVLRYGTENLIAYTVGDPDGTNNGIGFHWHDIISLRHGQHRMLIPQQGGKSTYGIGQACLVAKPYSPTIIIVTDTQTGSNKLRCWKLDVSGHTVTTGAEYTFAGGEDGASVSGYWISSTKLALIVTGGGWTGVRTYLLKGTTLTRQRASERDWSGNGFWAQQAISTPTAHDGTGIMRDYGNQPLIIGGQLQAWQARGPGAPATWDLARFTLPAVIA